MKVKVDDDVKSLLKEHSYLHAVESGEDDKKCVRVRCDLTQHELVPTKEAIETYLKTKKFIKAKDWYCYDYSKYEPYIVVHRRKPKCLYCNVTNTILNRIPAEVEKHVNGKRFKRLKEHVKFEVQMEENEDDGEFDANAFEFENQQAIFSDEEDGSGKVVDEVDADENEDNEEVAGSDNEDDNDNDNDDEEEEDAEDENEEEDVMADFYPQDDDDVSEDEHIREAVAKITKKRKADKVENVTQKEKKKSKTAKPQQKNTNVKLHKFHT